MSIFVAGGFMGGSVGKKWRVAHEKNADLTNVICSDWPLEAGNNEHFVCLLQLWVTFVYSWLDKWLSESFNSLQLLVVLMSFLKKGIIEHMYFPSSKIVHWKSRKLKKWILLPSCVIPCCRRFHGMVSKQKSKEKDMKKSWSYQCDLFRSTFTGREWWAVLMFAAAESGLCV